MQVEFGREVTRVDLATHQVVVEVADLGAHASSGRTGEDEAVRRRVSCPCHDRAVQLVQAGSSS